MVTPPSMADMVPVFQIKSASMIGDDDAGGDDDSDGDGDGDDDDDDVEDDDDDDDDDDDVYDNQKKNKKI